MTTTLEQVAREAATGASAPTIAARLGTSPGLVDLMLDELIRCGRLDGTVRRPATAGGATQCGSAGGACDEHLASCAGCPLAGPSAGAAGAAGAAGPRFLGFIRAARP